MRRDLGQRPAGEPGEEARSVSFATHVVRNDSAGIRGRHNPWDGSRREVVGQEIQGRHLELDRRRSFEGGGDLQNELAAVPCVHVEIALALAGQRAQSPAKTPVRGEDGLRIGRRNAGQGVGQRRHEEKVSDGSITGIGMRPRLRGA